MNYMGLDRSTGLERMIATPSRAKTVIVRKKNRFQIRVLRQTGFCYKTDLSVL
jgi:hypothetical protein